MDVRFIDEIITGKCDENISLKNALKQL